MPENTEETPEEGAEEETEKEPADTEKMGAFLSPEGILMMGLAILIDMAGLFSLVLIWLFGVGFIISTIFDVAGLVLIGGWMLLRSGQITATKGAKKAFGKLLKRGGLSFIGESIPIFGDIAPCWTLAVYFELKNT